MSTELIAFNKIQISVYKVKYDDEPHDFPNFLRMSMNNALFFIEDLRKKFVSSGEYSMQVATNTAEILNNCSSCIQILSNRLRSHYMGEKANPEMGRDFFEIMNVVLKELENMVYYQIPKGMHKSNYLGHFIEWQAKKWDLEDLEDLEKRRAWHKAEQKKAKDAAKKLRAWHKAEQKKAKDAAKKLRSAATSPQSSPKSSSVGDPIILVTDEEEQNMLVRSNNALAPSPSRQSSRVHVLPTISPEPSLKSSSSADGVQNMLDGMMEAIDAPPMLRNSENQNSTPSQESIPSRTSESETEEGQDLMQDLLDEETEVEQQETSQDSQDQIVVLSSQSEVSCKHDSVTDLHRPASSTESMNNPDLMGPTLKEKMANLLDWCKERTTKYDLPMYSFSESWKSGRALIAIMHSYDEDLINPRYLTKESPQNTLTYGEWVARALGVLCPMDFAHECLQKHPNPIKIMQFVMELRGRLEALF